MLCVYKFVWLVFMCGERAGLGLKLTSWFLVANHMTTTCVLMEFLTDMQLCVMCTYLIF